MRCRRTLISAMHRLGSVGMLRAPPTDLQPRLIPALNDRRGSWHASLPLLSRERQHCVRTYAATSSAKTKELFKCSECSETTPQWKGRCPSCSAWNTLAPFVIREGGGGGGGGAAAARSAAGSAVSPTASSPASSISTSRPRQYTSERRQWVAGSDRPQRISDVRQRGYGSKWRLQLAGTNGAEVSRVLGGGVVPGSMILIGGDPGVGKSTLLLQVADMISQAAPPAAGNSAEPINGDKAAAEPQLPALGEVLYVSGEESVEQIGSRAERMGLIQNSNIFLYSATRMETILQEVIQMQPVAVIIDSIQTVYLDEVNGSAGSVSQVRECATALLHVAKREKIPIFLIGHVTKSGDIAGPRVLEHVVDVVLYMEGERQQSYRLLRGIKNRYGATDEVGVFAMAEEGLLAVQNPSELFLSERNNAPGISSAVTVTLEGTRPLLLEVQGLCSPSQQGTPPVRVPNGVHRDRLSLILAVLSKHTAIKPFSVNIHTNVVGGMTMREPSTDVAIALAVASSYYERPVSQTMVAIGELGLAGELRQVSHLDRRLMEASKLGFTEAIVPHPTTGPATAALKKTATRLKGLKLHYCRTVSQAIQVALGGNLRKAQQKEGQGDDDWEED